MPSSPFLARGDDVVEQPHALLERAVERLLLAAEPHLDRVPLLVDLGIAGAISSCTTSAKRGRNASSMPIRRPWTIARRIRRRST